MALTDSLPTEDASGLSITDTRLIFAGLIARDATGAPRLGVFPTHTNPLVTGTSGMSYSVAAFVAATSRNGSGVELVANDGATTVATTAAPGSNSRIDVIWVRCRFPSYTDSGQTTPLFGVTQGTASGTPTKPAIPAGAYELATATVPSTATATNSGVVITQTYRYTAAAGGVVFLRNQTEMDAWAPADGSLAYRIDEDRMRTRIDGSWDEPLPPLFEGRFRRSDGQQVINAGATTLMRWEGTPTNTLGGTATSGANGATYVLGPGTYWYTATLKVSFGAQNYSQMIVSSAGATTLLSDESEWQTPSGFFEMAVTRLLHVETSANVATYVISNNAGTMRLDGYVRIVRA